MTSDEECGKELMEKRIRAVGDGCESQILDAVRHPAYYGGKDNPYETLKVIDAWGLGFSLGNAVKYISRAGRKDPVKRVEDLRKAIFYIQHEIERLME